MILSHTSTRVTKLKAEGAKRRAALLALVPHEFTHQQMVDVTGESADAISGQIQKMVKWREIEPTTAYKKPRTYRKVAA